LLLLILLSILEAGVLRQGGSQNSWRWREDDDDLTCAAGLERPCIVAVVIAAAAPPLLADCCMSYVPAVIAAPVPAIVIVIATATLAIAVAVLPTAHGRRPYRRQHCRRRHRHMPSLCTWVASTTSFSIFPDKRHFPPNFF
jgi:hypothetical protein